MIAIRGRTTIVMEEIDRIDLKHLIMLMKRQSRVIYESACRLFPTLQSIR